MKFKASPDYTPFSRKAIEVHSLLKDWRPNWSNHVRFWLYSTLIFFHKLLQRFCNRFYKNLCNLSVNINNRIGFGRNTAAAISLLSELVLQSFLRDPDIERDVFLLVNGKTLN